MKLNPHVENVCKIGQGSATCRYLLASGEGWSCAKIHPDQSFKAALDARVAAGKMKAVGDNCEGKSAEFLNADHD